MAQFKCPRCGETIQGIISKCPHCGQRFVFEKGGDFYSADGLQAKKTDALTPAVAASINADNSIHGWPEAILGSLMAVVSIIGNFIAAFVWTWGCFIAFPTSIIAIVFGLVSIHRKNGIGVLPLVLGIINFLISGFFVVLFLLIVMAVVGAWH